MREVGSIRVATFNIQHASDGDYDSPGNPELLAESCKELDADILGLQEVDLGVPRSGKANLAEAAAEATGMNYVFGKARTFRGRGQFGNALLARGEISDVEMLKMYGDWHTANFLGRRRRLIPEPRNVITANVLIDGRQLSVGVTHVGGSHGNRKEQIGRAAAMLAGRPYPQILLGDLNIHHAAAQECVEPYGLEAIKGPNTSEAWNPRQQIDHIAINGLHLVSIEAHPRLPVSDHLALVAELKFAELATG